MSVKSHLTSRMSNRAINDNAYLVAYERQKICGDLLETTAFKRYAAKHDRKSQYANLPAYPRSAFSTRRTAKRQRLPRDCQRHSALSKTMPTDAASLCWSTDSTKRASTTRGVANFRARVLAFAPRVCTLVLFIFFM